MRTFTATTEGPNRLRLRELLQRYADEQWVADHLTDEQVAESMLDCFKRAVAQELELLDLGCQSRGDSRTALADLLKAADEWEFASDDDTLEFTREQIERGTQWAVFEPNDEPLWAEVRRVIGAFLRAMFHRDALKGSEPEEAYFVRVDRTTMSADDIENGRLIIHVGLVSSGGSIAATAGRN